MLTFPLVLLLALATPATANSPTVTTLPEGVGLSLRLDTVIDSKESHAGDKVTATLLQDAKLGGKAIVPKRAVVHGRIEFLNDKLGRFTVGLSFNDAEFDGTKVELRAQLENIISGTGVMPPERTPAGMGHKQLPTLYQQDVEEEGAVHASVIHGDDETSGVKSAPGVGVFYTILDRQTTYRSSVPAFRKTVKLQGLQMNWRTIAAQ
jgi:hypothetical protein